MELLVFAFDTPPTRTLTLAQGDITRERVDIIVNAANSRLAGGGGVDGAIHRAAGPQVMEECRAIMAGRGPLVGGEAVATSAGRLEAKYIIHTAGPIYRDGNSGEEAHLRECFRNSLALAEELGCASIAFPSISTGVYGYPFEDATRVALHAMHHHLARQDAGALQVRAVYFGDSDFQRARKVADELFGGK